MKPARYGFVDIATVDFLRWQETKSLHDVLITIWDFDTLDECRTFVAGDVPSRYCAQIFERTNVRWDQGWIWDETEIDL